MPNVQNVSQSVHQNTLNKNTTNFDVSKLSNAPQHYFQNGQSKFVVLCLVGFQMPFLSQAGPRAAKKRPEMKQQNAKIQ